MPQPLANSRQTHSTVDELSCVRMPKLVERAGDTCLRAVAVPSFLLRLVSHLMRIVAEAYSAGLPYPIRFAPNEELVQVFICPAKSNLKYLMELGNGAVAAHQEATPDLGTDFSYPDTQLIHRYRLIYAAHAFPLLA